MANFDTVNAIIGGLTIEAVIESEVFQVDTGFFGILADVEVGSPAVCTALDFKEGAAAGVTGDFVAGTSPEEYQVQLGIERLGISCDIPLRVAVGELSDDQVFGTLNFVATEGFNVGQSFSVFSPDFSVAPPTAVTLGECSFLANAVTFEGSDLGTFWGIDITGTVLDTVRGDPVLVTGEFETAICGLIENVTGIVSDFLVDSPILDLLSPDPFVAGADGSVPALAPEEAIPEGLNLVDLSDQGNFIVELLLEANEADALAATSLIYDLAPLLLTQEEIDSGYDVVVLAVGSLLGADVIGNNGAIVDVDIVGVLVDLGILEEGSATIEILVEVSTLTVAASITIDEALFSLDPPTDEDIIKGFFALGEQTVKLPRLNLNDLDLAGALTINIDISNVVGDSEDPLLPVDFTATLTDTVTLAANWDGFVTNIGALLPIDLDIAGGLNIGPLIDNLITCALSIFNPALMLSGLTLESSGIGLSLDGYSDAIIYLLDDIVDIALPLFGPVLPGIIETLVAEFVVGVDFTGDEACPEATADDTPFDFTTGIIADISGLVTPELVNDLLGAIVVPEGGLDVIELIGLPSIDILVDLELLGFVLEGLGFQIDTLSVSNFQPPELTVTDLAILSVPDAVNAPQQTETRVAAESDSFFVTLGAFVSLAAFPDDVNYVSGTVSLESILVILGLLANVTNFGVNSMQIENLLNFDCWIARLGFPGGVTELVAELGGLDLDLNCDCTTGDLSVLVGALSNDANQESVQATFNDLLAGLQEDLFPTLEEADFNARRAEAAAACPDTRPVM